MNKIELYNAFKNIQMVFLVSHASWYLFDNPIAMSSLDNFVLTFKDGSRPFSKVFENPNTLEHALKEYRISSMRAVISESWELVNDYCKNEGTHELLNSQPWYHFIRLIRNGLSHNNKFIFKPFDKTILPITWNGKIITKEMEGEDIQFNVIGYDGIWKYMNELDAFIMDILRILKY